MQRFLNWLFALLLLIPLSSYSETADWRTQVAREAAKLERLYTLIVVHEGQEVLALDLKGTGLDTPTNIKSLSKTVLAAMVGIGIEKGVFEGIDQPVVETLGDRVPASATEGVERITLGHLLSLQAGLRRTSGQYYGPWVNSENWVHHVLTRPFVDAPGGRMLYSTGSSHLLSAALTESAGRSTLALAREWLGEPLNITIPAWGRDPQGIYFGGNDMRLTPSDLARFGELYRLGGEIDGQRIVPSDWIEESWTPRTRSPWSGESYGYNWFLSQAGEYAVNYGWGYGGQMVFVVPELDLTVVMTSDIDVERGSDHIGDLRALLRDHIVPAAAAGGDFTQS